VKHEARKEMMHCIGSEVFWSSASSRVNDSNTDTHLPNYTVKMEVQHSSETLVFKYHFNGVITQIIIYFELKIPVGL
jgi:hypothetical protein